MQLPLPSPIFALLVLLGIQTPCATSFLGPEKEVAISDSVVATSDFQVHYIDVGTGDCIWIKTADDGIPNNGRMEGLNIIIDGGDAPSFGRVDGYEAASKYLTEDDKLPKGAEIDWMIMSHPHSDHCGGLDNFLDDYEVLNILDPGHDPLNADGIPATQRPSSVYGRFFSKAATEIANGHKANYAWGIPADFELDWGSELAVQVLHSSSTVIDGDLNNTSIVLLVAFADSPDGPSFLFTGDAEEAVEEHLVETLGGRSPSRCPEGRPPREQVQFNDCIPGGGASGSCGHFFRQPEVQRLAIACSGSFGPNPGSIYPVGPRNPGLAHGSRR